MSSWWRDRDYLPQVSERVITAATTVGGAAEQIMRDAEKPAPDVMTEDELPTA